MSKSGEKMDDYTKGIQSAEGINSTITYRETGCGIEATVTTGNGEYISQSYDNKDDARNEAATMAEESLGFLYKEENDG